MNFTGDLNKPKRYNSPPREQMMELRNTLEAQIEERSSRKKDKEYLSPKIGARMYVPPAATPPWHHNQRVSHSMLRSHEMDPYVLNDPTLQHVSPIPHAVSPEVEHHYVHVGNKEAVESAVQVSAPEATVPPFSQEGPTMPSHSGPRRRLPPFQQPNDPYPQRRLSTDQYHQPLAQYQQPLHNPPLSHRSPSPIVASGNPFGSSDFVHRRYHYVDEEAQQEQVRKSKELSAALLNQMDEKRRRDLDRVRKERDLSRELLSNSPFSDRASPQTSTKVPPPAHVAGDNAEPLVAADAGYHHEPVVNADISLNPAWTDKKLFDLDKREEVEMERKRAAVEKAEELKAELEKQIMEKQRLQEEQEAKEKAIEHEMEMRAQREAEELAEQERKRLEEAARTAQEIEQANRELLEQPHNEQSHGRRKKKYHHETDKPPNVRPPSSVSPAPSNVEVMDALRSIRDELMAQREMRSTPIPIVPPSQQFAHTTPEPISHTPEPDLARSAPNPLFNLDRYNSGSDGATEILNKNRNRLGALRHAQHHDDILQAFLLQDSTSAMRSLAAFKGKKM